MWELALDLARGIPPAPDAHEIVTPALDRQPYRRAPARWWRPSRGKTMNSTADHDHASRPPSPWSGSQYETQHRWQLDDVRSLTDAAEHLTSLAAELTAAHTAGWWLREPLRNGHLLAAVPSSLLDELRRQLRPAELGRRRWGIAPARVGPSLDLVAEGSALRIHAVHDGALVRTVETLTFQHAADGATTLLAAAAAYERLARAAEAMDVAGGHLLSVDDGRLYISYPRR
jgi:hypothetical protein